MNHIKSFLSLAEFVLKNKQEPMNEFQIWEAAQEFIKNKIIEFSTEGRTPWNTISARIYMDLKTNPENTKFVKLVKPKRFALKGYMEKEKVELLLTNTSIRKKSEKERDLHKYLSFWLKKEKNINSKTIFHEASLKNKTRKGEIKNQWLYPDMVGVEFLFSYFDEVTTLVNNLAIPLIKLYSFELKNGLSAGNVREAYFQAVSNSSWANEGYLVVANAEFEQSVFDELQRLNNAFGIGVIQLYTKDNLLDTEIILPSKIKTNIDIATINHLAKFSPDMKAFINTLNEVIRIKMGKETESNKQLYINAQTEYFDSIDESLVSTEE